MVANTKNIPLNNVDNNITGRRLNFAIIIGLQQTIAKFMKPIPKFAHLASFLLRPADSNIITE